MDKYTRNMIIKGVALFAAGALAGALVANAILREKYEKLADDEVAKVREHYKKKAEKQEIVDYTNKDAVLLVDVVSAYPDLEDAKAYNSAVDDLKYRVSQHEIARLNETLKNGLGVLDAEEDDPEDDPEDDLEEGQESEEVVVEHHNIFDKPANGEPYVISWEQFSEENNSWSKVTLDYYEGDDTLADDNDEPVPDIIGVLGKHALDNFGNGSHDDNVVYVRNEKISTDFEVVRKEVSYREYVLGIVEEEPKNRIGRMRANYDG